MTSDATIEAVARAVREYREYCAAADISLKDDEIARACIAALPPEMRAAGEMKLVVEAALRVRDGGPHAHYQRALTALFLALDAYDAALALASSPGQQSTKDGEEG